MFRSLQNPAVERLQRIKRILAYDAFFAIRKSVAREALFAFVLCKMGAAILLPQLLRDSAASLGKREMRWAGTSASKIAATQWFVAK